MDEKLRRDIEREREYAQRAAAQIRAAAAEQRRPPHLAELMLHGMLLARRDRLQRDLLALDTPAET